MAHLGAPLKLAHVVICRESDRGIGLEGHLLFHAPLDMKRFKTLTWGQAVIMGRATFKSLNYKPLKNRVNIVVTSSPLPDKTVIACPTLQSAVGHASTYAKVDTIFIIGGQRLYEESLPCIDEVYMTVVRVKESEEKNSVTSLADRFYPVLNSPYFRLSETTDWIPEPEVVTGSVSLEYKFQKWIRDKRFICPALK